MEFDNIMKIELLNKQHFDMGFLDVLAELTEVNLTPEEAIDKCSYLTETINGYIFVAIENDRVVGTAALYILHKFIHKMGKVGLIEDVVVARNHRQKGIGKLLIDHAVDFAKSHFAYKLILNCSLNNIQFYEKCGFHNHEYQMRMDLK